MEDFKITLRAARVNKQLSIVEAAKKLGICSATLGRYERSVSIPDWNVVEKMSELYGVPIDNFSFKF